MINISLKKNFKEVIKEYYAGNEKEVFDLLYNAIITDGEKSFSSIEDYSNACYLAVQICLKNNDYMNSNNIIQCYKNDTRYLQKDEWYYVYSIKIYGKRTPAYFLLPPKSEGKSLEKKISMIKSESNRDNILCELLYFYYNDLHLVRGLNVEILKKFIKEFINKGHKNFDSYAQAILDLLEGKVEEDDFFFPVKIESNYLLELQLKLEEENVQNFDKEKIQKEINQHSSQTKEFDFRIITNNPKICIIGASQISDDEIYKICKRHNIPRKNIDLCTDYARIQKFSLVKYQYNFDCIGIIIGPIAHSNVNNSGYSSICAALKNQEGYPLIHECRANSSSRELKITKKTLEEALTHIITNYEANKVRNP